MIANAAVIDTLIIGTGAEVWIPPSWLRDSLEHPAPQTPAPRQTEHDIGLL